LWAKRCGQVHAGVCDEFFYVAEDIEIHFIEERNGEVVWSAHGEFQPIHVHKQVAITFRTPSYVNKEVRIFRFLIQIVSVPFFSLFY